MTFPDYSPGELLQKLRRAVERLDRQEMHANDIADICSTAWHMIELVEARSSDREVRRRVGRLRSDPDIRICRYIAISNKHPKVNARTDNLSEVNVEQGWGVGRFDKGAWDVGEQHATFVLRDGTERDAREFASTVLAKWESVFRS